MRPPDPTLDDAIERFWRECRMLFAGRRILTVEKAGGVASSIPTLMWQLQMIERGTGGHMAGIAVNVGIQAFTDKFGNAAYSWILTPLQSDDAQELRSNIEGLVRIEGQVPKALPPMDEQADPDIYGITEAPESRQIAAASDDEIPFEPPEPAGSKLEPPEELGSVIAGAEALFRMASNRISAPPAKVDAIRQTQLDNRAHAAKTGDWSGYHRWLQSQVTKLNREAEKAQGALV